MEKFVKIMKNLLSANLVYLQKKNCEVCDAYLKF